MINLTSKPAFGYETASCNSENWLKNFLTKKVQEDYSRGGSLATVCLIEAMEPKALRAEWKMSNVKKALGYFPLVGSVIGFNRIVQALKYTKADLPNKVNHIIRGILEFIPVVGFLLLFVDLFMTAYRPYTDKPFTLRTVLNTVLDAPVEVI
jgi:hypothetical protein